MNSSFEKNWIEHYWDLMSAENFEDAIPLKETHFPRSFFKYKALSLNTIDSIKNQYLWLADVATLNDPFEGIVSFDNDKCLREYYASSEAQDFFTFITGQKLSGQEITLLTTSEKPFREYIKICQVRNIPFRLTEEEHLKKIESRWREMTSEQNKNIRICSFSLIQDSKLMWAHYSNEHKGICIEYDLLFSDNIRPFLQPVLYRNHLHKLGLYEEYTTIQMVAANLIKSTDWSYEEEWRLTIFKRGDNFPNTIPFPVPKSIFLGTRFSHNSEDLKFKLLSLAKQLKIPLYQMTNTSYDFNLSARPFQG